MKISQLLKTDSNSQSNDLASNHQVNNEQKSEDLVVASAHNLSENLLLTQKSDKKRKVTFAESVDSDDESAPKLKIKIQKIKKPVELTENQKTFLDEKLPSIFRQDLIDLLKYNLDFFKCRSELFGLVKRDNFALFKLFLEHKNCEYIKLLLEHLTHAQRLTLLTNDDYQLVRDFIKIYGSDRDELEKTINPIIKTIQAIEPTLELNSIVEKIQNDLRSSPTLRHF